LAEQRPVKWSKNARWSRRSSKFFFQCGKNKESAWPALVVDKIVKLLFALKTLGEIGANVQTWLGRPA
jgi:hypothetical protein